MTVAYHDHEIALLASVLRDPAMLLSAQNLGVSSADFYADHARVAWECIAKGADAATLLERLDTRWKGAPSLFGNAQDLVHFVGQIRNTPVGAGPWQVSSYVEQLKQARGLRGCERLAADLTAAVESRDPVADIVARAEKRLGQIERVSKVNADESITFATLHTRAHVAAEQGQPERSWQTDLGELDALACWSHNPYAMIMAPSSHGKTHFLMSILDALSKNTGPTLLLSLELDETTVLGRAAAVDPPLQHPLCHIVFAGQIGTSLAAVERTIRRYHAEHGIVAVGLDYIQLLTELPGSPRDRSDQRFRKASERLAALLRELGILGLMLVQDNNGGLERIKANRDPRPDKGDISESKALFNTADLFLGLYRPAKNPNEDLPQGCEKILEISAMKRRTTPVGRHPLWTTLRWDEPDETRAGSPVRAPTPTEYNLTEGQWRQTRQKVIGRGR